MVRRGVNGSTKKQKSSSLDGPTRRALLGALGVGAGSALAGCFGGEDGQEKTYLDDVDVQDLDMVDGQTLRLTTHADPAEMTFLGTGAFPFSIQVGDTDWVYPGFTNQLMMEHGMWGEWSNEVSSQGEARYLLYEDVQIEPDEITIQVKDSAKWSNGDDVNGRDVLTTLAAFRQFPNGEPFENVRSGDMTADELGPNTAITDMEFSGKTATVISEGGYFDEFVEQDVWRALCTKWQNWAGIHQHSRIEPYDQWSQAIWDHWDAAQAGDVNPWGDDPEEWIITVTNEAIAIEEDTWAEHQRDPDNTAFCGPWKLEEIRGSQDVVLTPNEHHRNYDDINFEEIVIEYREEDRASWAALQAERLDYFDAFMPPDVVESLPGTYEERLQPTDSGLTLTLDHSSELFEDVRARRAFMRLIDTEQLAKVEGESTNDPIRTLGASFWDADEWLDDEFVENNLTTYDHDPEAAEELLGAAGWSKEDGEWYLPSGDRASLEVPTKSDTPRWEVSIVDQLDEFGIEATLQTYDDAVYSEKRITREFDLWEPGVNPRENWMIGYMKTGLAKAWQDTVVSGHWATMHNMYPQEQIDDAEFNPNPAENQELGLVADGNQWEKFSIEAPPVGEWDGELQEWNVVEMGSEVQSPQSDVDRDQKYRELAWLTNWFVPVLPLTNARSQMAINTGNWIWPGPDSDEWAPVGVDSVFGKNMIGMSHVYANPDNPRSN